MKKTNSFLIALLFSANVLAVDLETEPNNEMKDANSITPGVMLTGQLSEFTDDDWFFFEISSSDVLTITLNNPDQDSHGKLITVYDAEKNELYTQTFDVDESSNEETITSSRVGLKNAGKFFIEMIDAPHGGFTTSEYQMTINLENQPPFTVTTTCPANPSFSGATGILEIPAVDVSDAFGGFITYNASMKLVPSISGSLTFEVTEASVKE